MKAYVHVVLVLAMLPFLAGLAMMILGKEEKLALMMKLSLPVLAVSMIPVVVYAFRHGVIR